MITTFLAAMALFTPGAAPPGDSPVPQDEVAYLEESFLVHLTELADIAAEDIAYTACDARWVEDHIVSMCFAQLTQGPAGSEIVTTLVTHTADTVSFVPTGSYIYDQATTWIDPALIVEVDAPPLPPR